MEVTAKLKRLQISPRKVRLVADLVRGLDVVKAENILEFTNKGSAPAILKLLRSAIANGTNNKDLTKENLYIKTIFVDEGFTLKRWKPRAMGRATPIRKRSSQITIILDERKKTAEKKEVKKTVKKEVTKKIKKTDG
ncbi:MAG: 50S ribosomal protein L22 [Patescibacteria group bacterium]